MCSLTKSAKNGHFREPLHNNISITLSSALCKGPFFFLHPLKGRPTPQSTHNTAHHRMGESPAHHRGFVLPRNQRSATFEFVTRRSPNALDNHLTHLNQGMATAIRVWFSPAITKPIHCLGGQLLSGAKVLPQGKHRPVPDAVRVALARRPHAQAGRRLPVQQPARERPSAWRAGHPQRRVVEQHVP